MKFYISALLLAIMFSGKAQTEVIIGTGTSYTNEVPLNLYYDMSVSRLIYHDDEIGEAGAISKVALFVRDAYVSCNGKPFKLYVRETSTETFSGGSSTPSVGGYTLVFDGVVNWQRNQWNEIEFDSPFNYSNSQNLELYFRDETDGDYCFSQPRFHYETKSNRVLRNRNDSSFPSSLTLDNKLPNLKLWITPSVNATYFIDTIHALQPAANVNIPLGGNKQEVIGINIKVAGNQGALPTLNDLNFNLSGTTNINDIDGISIYETGSNANFSTSSLVHSINSISGTNYSATGIGAELQVGNNYYWIAVDVKNSGSAVGHFIDAEWVSANVNSTLHPANPGTIAGAREIVIEPIVIGSPASTSNTGDVPLYLYSDKSASTLLYLDSEIGQSGSLEKIGFFVTNNPSCSDNVKIYVRETSLDWYPNGDIPMPNTNDFTLVYDGTIAWQGNQWNEIVLDAPFSYTGTQNLEFYFRDETGSDCGFNYPRFRSDQWKTPSSCFSTCSTRAMKNNSGFGSTFPADLENHNNLPHIQLFFGVETDAAYFVDTIHATQPKANVDVNLGYVNQEIIGLNIKVSGNQGDLPVLDQLNFNLNGTTEIDDILHLSIFKTGSVSSYDTTTRIYETNSILGNDYSAMGLNETLSVGNNYFWIGVNITDDATAVDNILDAEWTNTYIESSFTPPNPGTIDGGRKIKIDPVSINPSNSGCGNSLAAYPAPASYDDWNDKFTWSSSIYENTRVGPGNGYFMVTYLQFFTDCRSCSGYNLANNQKIYLGTTDVFPFNNTNRPDNDPNVENLTLVFDGSVQWADGVWNLINLNTPYIYDNSKHLVMYYTNEHGGALGPGFFCESPTFIVDAFGPTGTIHTKYNNDGSALPRLSGRRVVGTSNQAPILTLFALPGAGAVLPVELGNFDVKTVEQDNQLFWDTYSEINTKQFEVEKSEDALNFEQIGIVAAAGNSTAHNFYDFWDRNFTKDAYYRLRIVDIDASVEYSNIVFKAKEQSTIDSEIAIFPNPVEDELTIQGLQAEQVEILDMLGRVMKFTSLNNQNNINTIDLADLPKGSYLAIIQTANGLVSEKIIKK